MAFWIPLKTPLETLITPLTNLGPNNGYDWETAEREYKRVISMTSSMASHSQYAILLATQGRFEEAIAEVKSAEKIDPSGPATNLDMLQIYYWRHQDDQALEQGREMLRKAPLKPSSLISSWAFPISIKVSSRTQSRSSSSPP
jgi:hypothetical protein